MQNLPQADLLPTRVPDPRRGPFEVTGDPELSRATGTPWRLAAFLVALTYMASWARFPPVWLEERTHGFAIAALCLWLFWRYRANLQAPDHVPQGGWLLVALLSFAWMLAQAVSAQVVHLILTPLVLLAWLLAVRGLRATRAAAKIAAVFSLAIPLWEVLLWPLQMMTVLINRLLLHLMRIPATVDGSFIHLPDGIIEVANSCAGLNYLMAGLTLGAAYAALFARSRHERLIVMGTSAAVAIVSNWIRVFGLVLIGHYSRMQAPLLHEHGTYGWVIFALSMFPLFFLYEKITQRPRGEPAPHLAPEPRVATDTMVSTADYAVTKAMEPTRGVIVLASAAALIGPLLYGALLGLQPAPAFPATTQGVAATIDWSPASPPVAWSPTFRGFQARQTAQASVRGLPVQLDRFLYATDGQGREMIGSGNAVALPAAILAQRSAGPLDANLRIVNEVVVRSSDGARLVWYWYQIGDSQTASEPKAKLLELWSFLTRSGAKQIVVLSAVCEAEDCHSALQSLFFASTGREAPPVPASPPPSSATPSDSMAVRVLP